MRCVRKNQVKDAMPLWSVGQVLISLYRESHKGAQEDARCHCFVT